MNTASGSTTKRDRLRRTPPRAFMTSVEAEAALAFAIEELRLAANLVARASLEYRIGQLRQVARRLLEVGR